MTQPLNIATTVEDFQKVLAGNPIFQLEVKCVALIRMLEERDQRIAELEAQIFQKEGDDGDAGNKA